MSNRFRELLGSTPPTTLGILAVCLSVYGLQLAMGLDLERFTMCPRLVLYVHEYYRIITSALFHGNLMHIGMNMLSGFHLSTTLEKRLGTLPHLMTTLGAILCTSIVYLAVAWTASFLFAYDAWMYQHSVGFSGVLFHFCVLESHLSSNTSRSLFGVINVPTYLYPWALLILLQFFMPNLSFLGHLSGILTGTLQYYGLLDVITIGPDLEGLPAISWLAQRLGGFVAAPSLSDTAIFQQPNALLHSMRGGFRSIFRLAKNFLETFSVCIFGRGRRWNVNIRLFNWSSNSTSGAPAGLSSTTSKGHVLGSALDEDEEWGGLPTIASLEKEALTSHIV